MEKNGIKKKVLLICTTDDIGGMERVVFSLSHGLTTRDFDVQTVFPQSGKSEALLAWSRKQGVVVETTPAVRHVGLPHSCKDVFALWHLVRRSKPDVVSIHYGSNFIPLKDMLAIFLATRSKCFVTIHQATPWSSMGSRKKAMTRLASHFCRKVVAICQATRELLQEAGVSGDKVPLLYCGVQPPAHLRPRVQARRCLGLNEDHFVLVAAARLTRVKGVGDLVEAVARIPDPHRRLRLVIAGDGPERAVLEARATSVLGERAVFLGSLTGDINDLYAAADVLALASYSEGLPLVFLEAAFHGVPAIASHVGGSPEAVLHEKTGLLVPPGDPAALAAAIARLWNDAGLRQHLGEAARARACSQFTESAMADRYAQLFTE